MYVALTKIPRNLFCTAGSRRTEDSILYSGRPRVLSPVGLVGSGSYTMPISKGVVVVVDPATTGGALAVEVSKRGYEVIALWTDECAGMEDHVNQETAAWKESKGYFCELKERPTIEDTAAYVVKLSGGKPPLAIMCGAESGVKVCDKLTEFLKMRGNTTANGMENRRDKMVQQNAVKKTGVRAVRGLDGKVWEGEIEEFVDSEPFPIVVKPVESAGSEGVKLVRTKEEAQAHFHLLMNSQRMIGASDAAVCIQEFLKGTECALTSTVPIQRCRPSGLTSPLLQVRG